MRQQDVRIKIIIIILFLISFSPFSAALADEPVKIVILHTNDFHGYLLPYMDKKLNPKGEIGGAAYLTALIEEIKKENQGQILLLDSGDMFQGTPISNIFRGRPVIEVMNIDKYDAATLGNHEFDWGLKTLKENILRMKFPVVCANLDIEPKSPLRGIILPYIIKEIKGIKFAVIGITTTETPKITIANNTKGLVFEPPKDVLNKIYPLVKSKGADFIIVLSHQGFSKDKVLAKEVNFIDIIVGGHSHTPVFNPPVVDRKTLVTQAGSYGDYLGKIVLSIDKANKKIKECNPELIPIIDKNIIPSKKVADIVAKYEKLIAPRMNKIVTINMQDLINCYGQKTDYPLGNLICDIMLQESSAQISFQNQGGIRASLSKGPVTAGDIYTLLPFDNDIVSMDLTGEQILEVLEHSFSGKVLGILIGGAKVKVNLKNPELRRIVEVKIGDKLLKKDKFYKVATNSFLATGGENYNVFTKGRNIVCGKLQRDAAIDYLKKSPELKYSEKGRIQIVSS